MVPEGEGAITMSRAKKNIFSVDRKMPPVRNLQICLSDFRSIGLAVPCLENRNISWSCDTSSESI
jgi:hypothetical protein